MDPNWTLNHVRQMEKAYEWINSFNSTFLSWYFLSSFVLPIFSSLEELYSKIQLMYFANWSTKFESGWQKLKRKQRMMTLIL